MKAQESDCVQITPDHIESHLIQLPQGCDFTFPGATDLCNSGGPEDRPPMNVGLGIWAIALPSIVHPGPILHPILKSGLQPKSSSFQMKFRNVTYTNIIKECIPYAGI